MNDGNPLERLTDRVSESVAGVAESLGDRVTGSAGLNVKEEDQYLLPAEVADALAGPLKDLGFPFEPKVGRVRDLSDKWHNFHHSRVKGGYIVFLYIGNKLLESSVHGNDLAWIGMLFSQNGAKGMFVFSDSELIQPAYDVLAEFWEDHHGFLRAKFFNYSYVHSLMAADFDGRKVNLQNWFKLSIFMSAAQISAGTLTFEDLKNDGEKIERIVLIIANTAANATGLTPQEFFNDLVSRAAWSNSWKTQLSGIWTGNAEVMARKLVGWALARKISTVNPSYTTIAGLLEPLIREDLDRDDGLYLFKLIQEHALITDSNVIQKIQKDCFGT